MTPLLSGTGGGMPQDMRTWIEELRAAGELRTVSKPVDAITEMGALIHQSVDKRRMAR